MSKINEMSQKLNLILILAFIIEHIANGLNNAVARNTKQMLSRLPRFILNAGLKVDKETQEAMQKDAPEIAKVFNYSIEAYKLDVFDELMQITEALLEKDKDRAKQIIESL